MNYKLFTVISVALTSTFISSCWDHTQDIESCLACDTLQGVNIDVEVDSLDLNDSLHALVVKSNNDSFSFSIPVDTANSVARLNCELDSSDVVVLSLGEETRTYTGFNKGWYYLATMSDHTAGMCGLMTYYLDGQLVSNNGMHLKFE